MIVYGHGLTGTQVQVMGDAQQDMANMSLVWWIRGGCSSDSPLITRMLQTDIGTFNIVPDRSHQGMLNQLLLMKVLAGRFSRDPLVIFNGRSALDPTRKFY